jgi:enamine deaminase RidA (YjgF/YER057c/UK114 family)
MHSVMSAFGGKAGAVGDAAAQWRNILINIKSDLEELGTSLEKPV